LFKGTYFPTWEGLFWEKACFALDTVLMSAEGRPTFASDIGKGFKLMGDDGSVRTVEDVVTGVSYLYEVEMSCDSLVVTGNHILCLRSTQEMQFECDG
jgi:pre-mRNA-processing factor 8